MENVKTKVILNVEIDDVYLITKLNIFSQELSGSLDELMLYLLEKLIYDIESEIKGLIHIV